MTESESERVEFYRHNIGDAERNALVAALDDVFVTTGARVAEFEQQLADFLGGRVSVLGTSSCSAAMHLALVVGGVGPGDEVITTPMTFVSTTSQILHAGATPVFADVEPTTGLLDVDAVEAAITDKTKAVLAVHLYGQMCDMRRLRELCDSRGLWLVEDAAHTLDASRDGARPGTLGDAAAFSFHAVKSITSAEGGALAMRDAEKLARARRLSLQGVTAGAAERYGGSYRHWDMVELGFKYNMTNLQAALLPTQLARADQLRAARSRLWDRYDGAFAELAGVASPTELAATGSRQMYTLRIDGGLRDSYLAKLGSLNIGVAVHYRAVHLSQFFRERFGHQRGTFPNAEKIGDETLTLPLYPRLTDEEQTRVIEAVIQA